MLGIFSFKSAFVNPLRRSFFWRIKLLTYLVLSFAIGFAFGKGYDVFALAKNFLFGSF